MDKLYLDTSVYVGYFVPEFEIWTKILFNKISQNEFQVLFSDVVDSELEKAEKLPDQAEIEFIEKDFEEKQIQEAGKKVFVKNTFEVVESRKQKSSAPNKS